MKTNSLILAHTAAVITAAIISFGAVAQPASRTTASPQTPPASTETKGASKLILSPERSSRDQIKEVETFSSLDRPDARHQETFFVPGALKFEQSDLQQVLAVYQDMSHRTVIRSA